MPLAAHSQTVSTEPLAVRAGSYEIDPLHSRVTWTTNHRGFSNYSGLLIELTGRMTLNPAELDRTTLAVTIPMDKGGGFQSNLDGVLQKTFFETSKYPTATFASTKVERVGERQARVTGDLTLKGATQPVTFLGTFNGAGVHPESKRYIIGFNGETTIKRSAFGMTAAPVIGDEVRLNLEAEFFAVE
jgi:polyisoprenoid-binding protein YceI